MFDATRIACFFQDFKIPFSCFVHLKWGRQLFLSHLTMTTTAATTTFDKDNHCSCLLWWCQQLQLLQSMTRASLFVICFSCSFLTTATTAFNEDNHHSCLLWQCQQPQLLQLMTRAPLFCDLLFLGWMTVTFDEDNYCSHCWLQQRQPLQLPPSMMPTTAAAAIDDKSSFVCDFLFFF